MVTRTDHAIPATVLDKLSTDLKLVRRRSYSCRYHRWKPTITPAGKLESFSQKSVLAAVNLAGVWPHHRLYSTPLTSSFRFRPLSSPETAGLPVNGNLQSAALGSSIRRRHRAWKDTAGTVGLTETGTIRPKLPVTVDRSPGTIDRGTRERESIYGHRGYWI